MEQIELSHNSKLQNQYPSTPLFRPFPFSPLFFPPLSLCSHSTPRHASCSAAFSQSSFRTVFISSASPFYTPIMSTLHKNSFRFSIRDFSGKWKPEARVAPHKRGPMFKWNGVRWKITKVHELCALWRPSPKPNRSKDWINVILKRISPAQPTNCSLKVTGNVSVTLGEKLSITS